VTGPRQSTFDFSAIKSFPFGEAPRVELRAEFFNAFNHPNLANPISNFNAVNSGAPSIQTLGASFSRATSESYFHQRESQASPACPKSPILIG
jgi:hypothetical protein